MQRTLPGAMLQRGMEALLMKVYLRSRGQGRQVLPLWQVRSLSGSQFPPATWYEVKDSALCTNGPSSPKAHGKQIYSAQLLRHGYSRTPRRSTCLICYPSAHPAVGDRSSLLCLCRMAAYGCQGFTETGDPVDALMAPTALLHSGVRGDDDSELVTTFMIFRVGLDSAGGSSS